MKKTKIFIAVFLLFAVQLVMRAVQDMENSGSLANNIYKAALSHSIQIYSPTMLYMEGGWEKKTPGEKLWELVCADIPLEKYMLAGESSTAITEYMQHYSQVPDENAPDDDSRSLYYAMENENALAQDAGEENIALHEALALEQAVLAENAAVSSFVPVQAPVALYSRQQLKEPGFIKKTFYAEDPTTLIRQEQLNYDTLMGFDAELKQDSSNVQILVYHTHSQETYIDSVQGDRSTSIVGVGEYLCELLRTQYGYNVLHHTGEYDVESRDYAYSNAMKGLNEVLAQNPTIEVMIDLHRDETNPNTRLVTTIQNKTMAKFMFFNGLCYTRELGTLNNLQNPYVQDNISFAFQMQLSAEEYYPGLTRRIYLKGYRYNLHYRPKSLLVELGSQTNTVEEARNACEPLAHVIDMVLSGQNKE